MGCESRHDYEKLTVLSGVIRDYNLHPGIIPPAIGHTVGNRLIRLLSVRHADETLTMLYGVISDYNLRLSIITRMVHYSADSQVQPLVEISSIC